MVNFLRDDNEVQPVKYQQTTKNMKNYPECNELMLY